MPTLVFAGGRRVVVRLPDMRPASLVIRSGVGPRGPQGEVGPPGAQGPMGPQGAAGEAGAPGATGPAGPSGDQGPTGPQGIQGPAGEVGPAGLTFRGAYDPGATYETNDLVTFEGSGYYSITGSTGVDPNDATAWELLVLQGAPGPQGPTGATGPAGDAGAAGPAGPAGPEGPQGPTGPQGAQGLQGPAGPQGDPGPAGPSGPSGGGALAGKLIGAHDATTTTLTVQLNGEWPLGAVNGRVLVDSELMLVTNIALVSGSTHHMSVIRGQLGTVASTHRKDVPVYARQPFGQASGGGDTTTKEYVHNQLSPAATWTVVPTGGLFSRRPSVKVYLGDEEVLADVEVYLSPQVQAVITFGQPQAGQAVLT